ncbi:MAG TPA: tRNA 2-thiocytidine biosynthesis protein TtcA [Candidatus Onthocola stercoravium]|nr:tRNA 2-thiocytidine biosynthesis protein TtcA [Candidatus Onthocola stercoravium]
MQSDIERSIIKTYRKDIWRKFTKAVTIYNLIQDNDKIAVCISGGKDSFLLAKCMQEIKKHGKIKFDLEFIVMDPGYSKENLDKVKKNAELLGIPIHVYESTIFESLKSMDVKSPCYMCARMRRGHLYKFASDLGCNKIALGHHYNDVIETIMLGILYNGEIVSMLPKIKSKNFPGMELIRPLYLVRESAIINWLKYNELEFINCACPLKKEDSKRAEVKELIKKLRETNKFVEYNIFKSVENININQVMGYIDNDKRYNYYDDYEE